jgi:hypothetical protein
MPPKKSTKSKPKSKPKPKKKPKTAIKQKQSQKQIVNQIVKVYLNERKKSKRTRSTPQKRNVSSGRQNINISPILSSPLNEMYSYRQPQIINPLTEMLNKLNANIQANRPTPEQIADMYDNKIIPGNPLVQPKPIPEKFPSLDPTLPSPNFDEGVEEAKESFIDEQEEKVVEDILKSDEEKRQEGEGIAHDIISDIIDKVDLPDPSSSLSQEEQLSIIKMYNQLRPPGRQGQRPTTMTGYLKSIKRYSKMRKDLLKMVD